MIRKLEDKDIDKVMNIWLESTIKAHDFISKEYWESNYDTVKEVYIPIADSFIYEEKGIIKGFISVIDKEFIGALFVDNNFLFFVMFNDCTFSRSTCNVRLSYF